MDGLATTRELRKRVKSNVPVVITSAYDWSDIELAARTAGANAFLGKPVFKTKLMHIIREFLQDEPGNNKEHLRLHRTTFDQSTYKGRRALIAEDNFLNAEIAGKILSKVGFHTDIAENGKIAVEMIEACEDNYYDVIFMDLQMPVMNGYEATRAIRAMKRDYAKTVPILALSANAFADDVQMAKEAGMNEHIAKPIDFKQIDKALKTWLK